MTTVVRPLRDDGVLRDGESDRTAALERVNELLTEAHERRASCDTEWVVDLASRRVVRRAVRREIRR